VALFAPPSCRRCAPRPGLRDRRAAALPRLGAPFLPRCGAVFASSCLASPPVGRRSVPPSAVASGWRPPCGASSACAVRLGLFLRHSPPSAVPAATPPALSVAVSPLATSLARLSPSFFSFARLGLPAFLPYSSRRSVLFGRLPPPPLSPSAPSPGSFRLASSFSSALAPRSLCLLWLSVVGRPLPVSFHRAFPACRPPAGAASSPSRAAWRLALFLRAARPLRPRPRRASLGPSPARLLSVFLPPRPATPRGFSQLCCAWAPASLPAGPGGVADATVRVRCARPAPWPVALPSAASGPCRARPSSRPGSATRRCRFTLARAASSRSAGVLPGLGRPRGGRADGAAPSGVGLRALLRPPLLPPPALLLPPRRSLPFPPLPRPCPAGATPGPWYRLLCRLAGLGSPPRAACARRRRRPTLLSWLWRPPSCCCRRLPVAPPLSAAAPARRSALASAWRRPAVFLLLPLLGPLLSRAAPISGDPRARRPAAAMSFVLPCARPLVPVGPRGVPLCRFSSSPSRSFPPRAAPVSPGVLGRRAVLIFRRRPRPRPPWLAGSWPRSWLSRPAPHVAPFPPGRLLACRPAPRRARRPRSLRAAVLRGSRPYVRPRPPLWCYPSRHFATASQRWRVCLGLPQVPHGSVALLILGPARVCPFSPLLAACCGAPSPAPVLPPHTGLPLTRGSACSRPCRPDFAARSAPGVALRLFAAPARSGPFPSVSGARGVPRWSSLLNAARLALRVARQLMPPLVLARFRPAVSPSSPGPPRGWRDPCRWSASGQAAPGPPPRLPSSPAFARALSRPSSASSPAPFSPPSFRLLAVAPPPAGSDAPRAPRAPSRRPPPRLPFRLRGRPFRAAAALGPPRLTSRPSLCSASSGRASPSVPARVSGAPPLAPRPRRAGSCRPSGSRCRYDPDSARAPRRRPSAYAPRPAGLFPRPGLSGPALVLRLVVGRRRVACSARPLVPLALAALPRRRFSGQFVRAGARPCLAGFFSRPPRLPYPPPCPFAPLPLPLPSARSAGLPRPSVRLRGRLPRAPFVFRAPAAILPSLLASRRGGSVFPRPRVRPFSVARPGPLCCPQPIRAPRSRGLGALPAFFSFGLARQFAPAPGWLAFRSQASAFSPRSPWLRRRLPRARLVWLSWLPRPGPGAGFLSGRSPPWRVALPGSPSPRPGAALLRFRRPVLRPLPLLSRRFYPPVFPACLRPSLRPLPRRPGAPCSRFLCQARPAVLPPAVVRPPPGCRVSLLPSPRGLAALVRAASRLLPCLTAPLLRVVARPASACLPPRLPWRPSRRAFTRAHRQVARWLLHLSAGPLPPFRAPGPCLARLRWPRRFLSWRSPALCFRPGRPGAGLVSLRPLRPLAAPLAPRPAGLRLVRSRCSGAPRSAARYRLCAGVVLAGLPPLPARASSLRSRRPRPGALSASRLFRRPVVPPAPASCRASLPSPSAPPPFGP